MRSIRIKNTHVITDDGEKIAVTLLCDGQTDYVTSNETLWKVLQRPELCLFRCEDRLAFIVNKKRKQHHYYLYDLASACYYGWLSADTYLEDMERYTEWKKRNDLSVDHADNNRANNTMLNLSLMEGRLNRIKASVVTHFTLPWSLVSARCGDEYRIQLSSVTTAEKVRLLKELGISGTAYCTFNFRCLNAEDYVACLRYLEKSTYEWMDGTAHENWRSDKSNLYIAGDIQKSMLGQKVLNLMDEKEFNLFQQEAEKIA